MPVPAVYVAQANGAGYRPLVGPLIFGCIDPMYDRCRHDRLREAALRETPLCLGIGSAQIVQLRPYLSSQTLSKRQLL
jgi:hypothetical protein